MVSNNRILLWHALIESLLSQTNWVLLCNRDMYTTLLHKRKAQNGKYTGEHTMHGSLMKLSHIHWLTLRDHVPWCMLYSWLVHKVPMLDTCSSKFYPWNYVLFKGAVRWCCFGVKPFNLAACFIMKCDAKCYDYAHQNGGPWTAVYNNVWALVTFFLAYNISIDWWEVLYVVEQ